MPVPIVVLNKLKPSKIILGFQIESGWSFVDSLNKATKINRVANKLRLAQGALMYAEIHKNWYHLIIRILKCISSNSSKPT